MQHQLRRFARMRQLEDYCSANRTTIYRWQKAQGFPQPFIKSETSALYDLNEIDRWFNNRALANRVEQL